jgi:hypothetical protein
VSQIGGLGGNAKQEAAAYALRPQRARTWAQRNCEYFWEKDFWISGNREFARGRPHRYGGDIDSGPVITGYGTAATAFGIGAARSLGQFEEARALSLQAIAASLPLPNGRLLLPRLLSDLSDAPLLGEAALLYNLSQPAAPGFAEVAGITEGAPTPAIVWLVLSLQLLLGSAGLWRALVRLRSVRVQGG